MGANAGVTVQRVQPAKRSALGAKAGKSAEADVNIRYQEQKLREKREAEAKARRDTRVNTESKLSRV